MNSLFLHDNIVAGVLVFITGFLFHWAGQLVSVLNWDLATRLGLQEEELPSQYKDYEHAIAFSDVITGIVYLPAAAGLMLDYSWAYKLAFIPGTIFLYHSLGFWFWTGNRRRAGYQLESSTLRVSWTLINAISGLLTLSVAWVRL